MIKDFFHISIGLTITRNRQQLYDEGKEHWKICRTQEGRKNRSCRTDKLAVLTLNDECTPWKNPET
ncbi:MAG: hypothetical protein ACTSWN_07120 [Promethearchaeota archaeon]